MLEFAQVDDLEILLYSGEMSVEPRLYIKEGPKTIRITVSSAEYENELWEFMLNNHLHEDYQASATKVMLALSDEIEELNDFTKFTLKEEYKSKLLRLVEEQKSGK